MAENNADRAKTAADVMTPEPRTCSTFSTVLEAVMIFRELDCGAVPILEDGKPIAVLTDRDVALALADHPDLVSTPVSEIMTRGVVSVSPDATLEAIKGTAIANNVRRVLVVDADERVVGIIAWSDVAPFLTDRELGGVVTDILTAPSE